MVVGLRWIIGIEPRLHYSRLLCINVDRITINCSVLKEKFPNVSILALTATATIRVHSDVSRMLSMENPEWYFNLIIIHSNNSMFILLKQVHFFL